MPAMTWAAQWSGTSSLTLSETYTSNVNIGSAGDEQDEFITQINPAITLSGRGRGLQLDFSYNMQNLLYARNDDRNATFHQLRAHALATLVENALFVDMASSVNQQAISLRERAPTDNLTISSNRTDTIASHISPYLRHAFGDVATTELRYGYDKVYYDATGADSESNSYSATISSGVTFKTFPWSLGYSRQQIHASGQQAQTPSARFEMYSANLNYVASRKLTFTTAGGYENNDYETSAARQKPGGAFWNAGLIWGPTSRTSLQASYGKRFFGNNYAFGANHMTRRSTWRLSYAENVTAVNLLQPESRVFMIADASTGNIFVDPQTGLPILATVIIPTLTSDVYVSKHWQASLGYQLKRNNFSLLLFNERRFFERTDELQRFNGGNALWGLQLAPHSRASLNTGWQHIEYSLDGQVDDFWHAGMTLSHDIQDRVKGAIELYHSTRNSSKPANEFSDNRVVARLTMTF